MGVLCPLMDFQIEERSMMGFAKEAIDLTDERWEEVQDYNACLERLIIRRKSEVTVQVSSSNPRPAGNAPFFSRRSSIASAP